MFGGRVFLNKNNKSIFATILVGLFLFASYSPAIAATASQLEAQKRAAEAKAKAAAQAAAEKAKQAEVVEDQLAVLEDQTSRTEQSLVTTESQINNTNTTIKDLLGKISEQQTILDSEKLKLNNIVASWYMEGSSGFLEAVIGADSISEVIDSQQYYDSVKQQVESSIERVTSIKEDLTNKKVEQEKKIAELNELQKSQEEQKNYLASRTAMKSRLLTDTNNAIVDLKEEQKVAEREAAELQAKIDRIRASSAGSGGDLTSGYASWYYSQVDPRWSSYRIGTYATIGQYGCLLTSLTMIANFYGRNYTPLTAAQVSSFASSGSLLSTPIVRDGRSQAINWGAVDQELAAGNPVILGIALGVDMGNSYGVSHFVVVKTKLSSGKYEMLDPLGPGRGYYKSQVKAYRVIRP